MNKTAESKSPEPVSPLHEKNKQPEGAPIGGFESLIPLSRQLERDEQRRLAEERALKGESPKH